MFKMNKTKKKNKTSKKNKIRPYNHERRKLKHSILMKYIIFSFTFQVKNNSIFLLIQNSNKNTNVYEKLCIFDIKKTFT